MKKALSMILAVVMLVGVISAGVVSAAAGTADIAATGKEYASGNYKYEVLSDGTAKITEYTGKEVTVNIPSTLGGYIVTEIGGGAFGSTDTPESITIPDSVKKIGREAFQWCKWLEKVTIGAGVEEIAMDAFRADAYLRTVVFKGTKLKKINGWVFAGCASLDNVRMPDSVTEIGAAVFYGCTSLKSITLSNNLTTTGDRVFQDCTSLTTVKLPDSLSVLKWWFFKGCEKLKSVTLPGKLREIESAVFENCQSLAAITLPGTLIRTEGIIFRNCASLKQLIIPDSVAEIGESFCESCSSLTNLKLSKSLTVIPRAAFRHCTALKKVKLPDSVTDLEYDAFADCPSLTSVVGKSVRNIAASAFEDCTSLKSAVLGDSLKMIGSYAFDGCEKLSAVYLPKSLREIASFAFRNCADPLHVYYSGSKALWNSDVTVNSSNSSMDNAVFHYNYNYSSLYATVNPTGIALPQKTTVYVGKTALLNPTFTPSNTTEKWLTWTSSNTAVAAVNDDGVVTGRAYGTAVITAKTNNGLSASCTVSVIHTAPKITRFENKANGVYFVWSKSSGAAKYRVFLKSGSKWTKLGDTAGTAYIYKKVKSGAKYTFTVRCMTADGKTATSGFSSTGWTTTFVAAPALPTLTNTKNGVQIAIKKAAGAQKYRIFRKAGNGKWAKLVDTTALKYVDKKAKNGVTYSYTVRCISKDGKAYTSAYNTTGRKIKCKR